METEDGQDFVPQPCDVTVTATMTMEQVNTIIDLNDKLDKVVFLQQNSTK